jgi:hypothetical protein
VINDGRLTLGDGGKMKLDTDPFPIGMVEIEHKKVLVHTDQAPQRGGWCVEGERAEEAA